MKTSLKVIKNRLIKIYKRKTLIEMLILQLSVLMCLEKRKKGKATESVELILYVSGESLLLESSPENCS